MSEKKSPKNLEEKETVKNKISDKVNEWRKSEKIEEFYGFAKKNKTDTLAYALLIIGVVLLLGFPFAGGLLIGIVAGFYFADEIVNFTRRINKYITEEGLARTLVLATTLLALFVYSPGIFIGAAATAALKKLLVHD